MMTQTRNRMSRTTTTESSFLPEAIIFILDASDSMRQEFPSSSTATVVASDKATPTFKFSYAKELMEQMMYNTILSSKVNQTCVILLNSPINRHSVQSTTTEEEEEKEDKNEDVEDSSPSAHVGNGFCRSTNAVHLLRHVHTIEIQPTTEFNPAINNLQVPKEGFVVLPHGTFWDGILLAAEIHYHQTVVDEKKSTTGKKKYKRRIVLFTDAEHEVQMDLEQLNHVVSGLRQMECMLTVMGIQFQHSAAFDHPALELDMQDPDDTENNHDSSMDTGNDEDYNVNDSDDGHDYGDNIWAKSHQNNSSNHWLPNENIDSRGTETYDDFMNRLHEDETVDSTFDHTSCQQENRAGHPQQRIQWVKEENEKFFIDLIKWTGGSVIALHTRNSLLQSNYSVGRRIPRSISNKMDLVLTPTQCIPVQISFLVSKNNIPSLKKEVKLHDTDGNSVSHESNMGAKVRTSEIIVSTSHWDADNPDVEVPEHKRSMAFKFGSDLIPIGHFDLEGLKRRSKPALTILGYTHMDFIPLGILIGPSRLVSGTGSRRSSVAIAALAQSLHRLKQIAICTFVSRADADPLMGILMPYICSTQDNVGDSGSHEKVDEKETPTSLVYITLPFADDIQKIVLPTLQDISITEEERACCDNLIDDFMLPDDSLRFEKISSPSIRSFHQTILNRLFNPLAPLSLVRSIPSNTKKFREENACTDDSDPMITPQSLLEKGAKSLATFSKLFPLVPQYQNQYTRKNKGGIVKKKRYWSDVY